MVPLTDLRKRLEELNRRPLGASAAESAERPSGGSAAAGRVPIAPGEVDELRRRMARTGGAGGKRAAHEPPPHGGGDAGRDGTGGKRAAHEPPLHAPHGGGDAGRDGAGGKRAAHEPPLHALHGGGDAGVAAARRTLVYPRELPRPQRRVEEFARPPGPRVSLAEAVSGEEVLIGSGGRAFVVSQDLRELNEESATLCGRFAGAMKQEGSNLRSWLALKCGGPAFEPREVMFVDLETTGLSLTPLFLIGTMAWEDGGLVVRQFFARNYAEERGVILLFRDYMAGKRLFVSFNGKSFDLPYVRLRAAATGVHFAFDGEHLDLVHVSRSIWKGKLPDCRLQTLERHICGRTRCGDVPGSAIPREYHEFVRTTDARVMAVVLRHNMLDLITLADLMIRLPPPPPPKPKKRAKKSGSAKRLSQP